MTHHHLNREKTVVVANHVYWQPVDADTPRGAKLQLLGGGGVAVYSEYNGAKFWTHWAPLPRKMKSNNNNLNSSEK